MDFVINHLTTGLALPRFGKVIHQVTRDEMLSLSRFAQEQINKIEPDLFDSRDKKDSTLVVAPKKGLKVAAKSLEQILMWLRALQQGKAVPTEVKQVFANTSLNKVSIQLPDSNVLTEVFGMSSALLLKVLQVLKYRKNLTNLKTNGQEASYVLNGRGRQDPESKTVVDTLIPKAFRYIQKHIPLMSPSTSPREGLPKFDDVIQAVSGKNHQGQSVLSHLFQVFSALGLIHAQKAPIGGLYRLKGKPPLRQVYPAAFSVSEGVVSSKWQREIEKVEASTFDPSKTLKEFAKTVGVSYRRLLYLRRIGAIKNDPVARFVEAALATKKVGDTFLITELSNNVNSKNYVLISQQLNRYTKGPEKTFKLSDQDCGLTKSVCYVRRDKPANSKKKGHFLLESRRIYTVVKASTK